MKTFKKFLEGRNNIFDVIGKEKIKIIKRAKEVFDLGTGKIVKVLSVTSSGDVTIEIRKGNKFDPVQVDFRNADEIELIGRDKEKLNNIIHSLQSKKIK